MKSTLIIFALAFIGIAYGQETKTIEIKTSAECGMCKKRIEEALNYTKGVKYAELDISNKVVTVKYNSGKTTAKEIRKKIAQTGYDADDMKAVESSVAKLPACCKPGGMK